MCAEKQVQSKGSSEGR